ncbi:MAG: type III pantothenate kinase [Candidatus Omnitrophota bacterium]|nr:type III pantothenate kinase [Candidatus Omnitrophota bacterium]
MKLLIDIGNTNTSLAVVKGGKVRKRYFIRTARKQVEQKSLRRLFGPVLSMIEEVVIVSVVPKFLPIIKRNIRAVVPDVPVYVVGRDIKVPMRIRYKKPGEVGQDRLVTSFSAYRLFGSQVLVVDFGTAVTFDLVNNKGDYEGGLIFPGLRLGLESLVRNTALLPRVRIRSTKGLIGRDTRSSMNKGIILGYAALCDGIIRMFREKYGKKLKVIATGGDAGLIKKYSSQIKAVYPDLLFEGLYLLSESGSKKN